MLNDHSDTPGFRAIGNFDPVAAKTCVKGDRRFRIDLLHRVNQSSDALGYIIMNAQSSDLHTMDSLRNFYSASED
jgi:hypothetical protein